MPHMAIRFQCGSCSQPIEIDDEWASKAVACPYCRKTVTAPMESTLDDPAQVPTASPLAGRMEEPNVGVQPVVDFAPPAESPNNVAVAAIMLACATLALYVMYTLILASHADEVAELTEIAASAQSFNETLEAQNEFMSQYDSPPAWMIGAFVCVALGGLTWIAASVCGIIGLRRIARRKLALAALLISGFVLVMICCGGVLGGG